MKNVSPGACPLSLMKVWIINAGGGIGIHDAGER